jgi:hypothetical protein
MAAGALIATCGMWNAGDREGMSGSNRGPWFGPGAILMTAADLYDTPNGEPPEPTAQDVVDFEFGFDCDFWLEGHPLRCLDAGLTLRVLYVDAHGARCACGVKPVSRFFSR